MSRVRPNLRVLTSLASHSAVLSLLAAVCVGFTTYRAWLSTSHAPLSVPVWNTSASVVGNHDSLPSTRFEVLPSPVVIQPNPIAGLEIREPTLRLLEAVAPYFDRRRSMEVVPLTAILHSVRLWGPEADFPRLPHEPIPLSGKTMADILLDHATLVRHCHLYGPGLLRRSKYGIEVIISRDFSFKYTTSATHFGELLDSLAESGMPSDHSVTTADGDVGTVADIVADDAARCVYGTELEFVTTALSRYAKNGRPWLNRFGQTYSFDKLATELITAPQTTASCDGTHVPYALVVLMRSDQIRPLLSAASRSAVEAYLSQLSSQLTQCQCPDGSWGKDWRDSQAKPECPSELDDEAFMRVVRVTSHHLEWMALVNTSEHRPSISTMKKAVDFLTGNSNRIEYCLKEDWHRYGNVTHVARCLALLSGQANDSKLDQQIFKNENITE